MKELYRLSKKKSRYPEGHFNIFPTPECQPSVIGTALKEEFSVHCK